ncbi:MAG: HAMP domain-containing histidine kinase [Planctomycetes bacterium]|nr:HAMP domain-containing histidine kinase [Planctomycetota bacterium]
MRVVYRLTVLLVLVACLVLTASGVLTVRSEAVMFERSMIEDARLNGQTLRSALQEVARSQGFAAVEGLVSSARPGKLEFRCLAAPSQGSGEDALTAAELASLKREGELIQIRRASPGQLRLYLPLELEGAPAALLEVRESLQREEEFLAKSIRRIAGATVVLVVLLGGVAFWLGVRVVGRPLELLREKAKRIGLGDLEGPVEVDQHDEIGQLAAAMNDMCTQLAGEMNQRQAAEAQLRHAERLATVGKLASGLAHELGTPLNVVVGRALEVVEHPECPAECAQAAQIVVDQAERMSTIVRQLLDFARRGLPRSESIELGALLQGLTHLIEPLARRRGVELALTRVGPSAWRVRGDPAQLEQAITNVALNGIQSMSEGGRLSISLESKDALRPGARAPERCAVITIRDEGAGIAAELLPQIFEPFFTTKDVGEGTGLGLAVAHGIVSDHGGWISVESVEDQGSVFEVHLPEEATQ